MNLIIYTNILTPYRKFFYDKINEICKRNGDNFYVLVMAETEKNRVWKFDELKAEYTILLQSRTISKGETYIHYNKNLKKVLKSLNPDMVVCAGSYLCPGVWEITKLQKKLKYKCLYWSESHLKEIKSSSFVKTFIREYMRKKIYKKFDGFWYAGKLSREFCEKYAKLDAEYFFCPNLIDESRYCIDVSIQEKKKVKEKLGLPTDKKIFICPARLSAVKGLLEFLELFNDCTAKQKATIIIAGDGELKNNIKNQAELFDIDVRLVGQKTQEEMINLYAAADIFLLPSLSDPNPLTCIEALWAGLPLLISEHCGNSPEVVKQSENGYVFSYNDRTQTVDLITNIIQADQAWFNQAKILSKKIAEEKYNSFMSTKCLVGEMKELCLKN